MSAREYTALEKWAQALAERQGLRLEKSQELDPHPAHYSTYQLVDSSTENIVLSGSDDGFGLGLDEVLRELR